MYPMMIKLGYSPSATRKLVEGISPREKQQTKSCKPVFTGPLFLRTALIFVKLALGCQQLGGVTKRNMMPLIHILIIEIFDCWGLDFMGPFPFLVGTLHFIGS